MSAKKGWIAVGAWLLAALAGTLYTGLGGWDVPAPLDVSVARRLPRADGDGPLVGAAERASAGASPSLGTNPAKPAQPQTQSVPAEPARQAQLQHVRHISSRPKGTPPVCRYAAGEFVGNLTWAPALTPEERAAGCYYMQYDREMAFKCLEGSLVVLYGNSNVRALYSALEGVLKNRTITPRLEAKQTCENNQKNHSCGMSVAFAHDYRLGAEGETAVPQEQHQQQAQSYRNVSLYYWGWVKGAYADKLASLFKFQKHASLVLGNTGVNVIQKSKRWDGSLERELPQYNRFMTEGFSPATELVWMSTTRICEAQPHYKKYAYKKSFWLGRSLRSMNGEIARYNKQHAAALHPSVSFLDAAGIAGNPALCPYYDDPLHHKAVDRNIANILLNMYCNAPAS
eukprot:TRINITY_DN35174_c0_g1_i2.p1 TRINITY_DN35174_c0_g1~~TRINITY_DN35174_c0_g1_i2.p1  ORF type:complete len:399 (+),score=94.31 TRINITY_DN35174_c0_g1_i2:78-1274(+)